MKKLLALIVVLSAATTGFGQHEVGAKIGYNHLFIKYDNLLGGDNTNATQELGGGGYVFGGYYAYTPIDNFYLQAELLFSNRMWNEVTTSIYEGEVTTTSQLFTHYSNNYLEIPLTAKYGINMRKSRYGGNKYLFFYGGTSIHVLATTRGSQQETFRIDAQGQTTTTRDEFDFTKAELKEHFTPVQASIIGGIQFNFEFGLNIDLRYQQLLMPVTNVGEDFGVLKQGMATFTVGYSFLRD